MLLSGGEPPAQEWLRVQNKSKPRVQRQRLPLQRIFRVKLSAFQGRPDTSYFWLRLEGPKENLSKAKEYLKGLCSPELWKEVRYPPVLHCVFLGAQGLFLDCLCWSSQAYLVPGAPGSLMVGGLTDSFVLTQNWLEELVGRLRWGSVPLFTPRGAREVEVSRAFGALVWLRADQYAGCLLQLPPAVQELLLSLVRDTAGKEDIVEWLGSVGPSPRPFLLPKQSLALVPAGDSAGPSVQAGAPRKGASENSKRLSSPGNTHPPPSSTPGQSPPQEAAKQLVWVSSRNQGDSEDSAGKEGASQGNGSSQDSANHTQAWSPQRQVQRVEDKLPFPPPPVSILGLCPPWKAWTPAPVAFGPLWPGAVAATFWRINELQSLHLAWLLSQAYLTFPFWQRPLGPIQLKLPGQTPVPLNLEWKPKELVPLPSVERLDGGPGGEAALQNCPSPETPHKVVSLLVVSGGPEAKDQASPGLLQIEPPLPSTPQAPAGSELGAPGSGRQDCEGLEGIPVPALPTGPEVPPTAERPGAQGALPTPAVLEAQVIMPETLKAPAVLEAQTVPETLKAPAVLEAHTVPETFKAPAVLEAHTVPETLKAPAVLEAQTVPKTFKAPAILEARTVPGTLKAPAVLEAQTVPETLKVPGAAAMPMTPALPSVPVLPAAAQVPAAPMMLPVAPAELADPRAPSAPAKPAAAQGVSASHKAAGDPLVSTAAATVPATAQTLPTQKGPVAEAAPTGRRGPKPPTGPVAQTGAVTPKGPAAPRASRAPQTPVAQKGSPGARSTSDATKLLSNAPPSPKGSASCPQGPPLSVRPHMEGLLGAWEGTPRQSPRHLQPSSTVTSFQRFHEALNTPFELALSEEPGDQGLRRVVIDGSSVAMVHGLQHFFSCRGIAMAVQYFWNRGHREVTVFVPTWQLKKNRQVRESHFLTKLHSLKMLSITPSQLENGKKVTTYDYRFMVKLAEETDGVLVTNEPLHVLMNNSKKHMVKDRLLPFTFAGNLFMVPDDPLGRDGPTLDEFLKKPNRLDTDVGNFLKVWKTLPPRPARLTELSEEDTLEPQENPQELVKEIREEERRQEHQEEGLEVQEPGGQEPGVQGEGLEVQEPGEKEPEVQELAEEDDDEGSLLASVFRLECPVLSEELLRCLSLPEAPHGVLDIDLLPGLPSPSLGVPWDGKPPCQQVLAHLARLTLPSNFTALSFFLGFMDSHRDVIPDYEALVGPLHSLLRLKPDWRWEREHELAFLALKRSLVSALCLSAPDAQLPFRLEVLVSQVALTAVVYQEHSGRRHPVAYTSKPLLPDEQGQGPQSGGDSPYAVAWALKHFSRCIGDSPVILDLSYAARPSGGAGGLEACQSPDNAWLIRWKLLVQDKGKRTLELTLLQGLLGENRRLMPAAALPRCFQALPPLSDLSTFVCIHMSGYCFSQDDDEWCSGFGLYVLSPSSPPVSLSFSCAPSTPTYAHLAAVACGLERFGQSQHPVVFLTHCSWIFSILWELLPLWQARGFLSSDGAPLPHPDLLSYIIALTSGLSALPFIYRTSYRGSLFAVTVDTLAKRGAQGEGPRWDLPKDVPSPVVSPRAAGKRPDLLALQLRDSTLADTIAKLQSGQRPPGSSPFGSVYSSLSLDRESGLLMFKGEKRPRVWVVPRQLRRDLIFSVHDLPVGAHQKPEETYKKVRLLGWWPGMQEYVRTYCRSCLFCTPQSPGGGELKVIESLWPLRSTAPWANLQIEVVGPVTASEEGHKHVLIVADPNTRWVEAFPLKPYSHAAVAQLLLQHVFARWGVPVRLEAAQGTQFARHVLVSCGLALGAQVASASRDLQLPSLSSSGAYWEFKRALREFILLYGRHWASCLPLLHLAFRASSLQDTPVQILMGAEGRLSGPLWWEMSGANIQGLHMDNFLRQLTPELLELHWREADKASEKAENRRFLRESQEREWKVGDQVLLLSLPRNGSGAKWVGPFYIGDRLSLSLYRVWGFPTPEKLGCIYPSSLMKAFANCATLLPLNVLEQ